METDIYAFNAHFSHRMWNINTTTELQVIIVCFSGSSTKHFIIRQVLKGSHIWAWDNLIVSQEHISDDMSGRERL